MWYEARCVCGSFLHLNHHDCVELSLLKAKQVLLWPFRFEIWMMLEISMKLSPDPWAAVTHLLRGEFPAALHRGILRGAERWRETRGCGHYSWPCSLFREVSFGGHRWIECKWRGGLDARHLHTGPHFVNSFSVPIDLLWHSVTKALNELRFFRPLPLFVHSLFIGREF